MSNLTLKKQIFIFLVIGTTTVLIDYIFYISILHLFNLVILAKTISYILGTAFSFFANRKWTFQYKGSYQNNILKFILLYSLSMLVNSLVNPYMLNFLNVNSSFIIATITSATLNFIGMKFYIFKRGDL